MRIDAIAIGKNPPEDVNVIIEVAIGGEPIKYEMDKEAGTLVVDRFLYTPMRYPGNYGFVPHTLSDDGDPIDVLVANTRPIVPGAVINVRPVGVLKMMDESGGDEKIIAVPSPKLTQRYVNVHNYTDMPIDHAGADPALFRALQGFGAQQVGQAAWLGRRRGSEGVDRGCDRSRAVRQVPAQAASLRLRAPASDWLSDDHRMTSAFDHRLGFCIGRFTPTEKAVSSGDQREQGASAQQSVAGGACR